MDPVSAFALACGVIQVVQASYGLVTMVKQLYRRGSLEQSDILKDEISQMEGLLATMNARRPNMSAGQAEQQEYKELVTLVGKANSTALELLKLLSQFEISGSHKAWQALELSPEIMWKTSTVKNLKKTLDDYRDLLDKRILVTVWYDSTKLIPHF